MAKGILLLLPLLLGLFQVPSVHAAGVNFTFSGPGNFSASQSLYGEVSLKHSEFIPKEATLQAYIDDELATFIFLEEYIGEAGEYAFKPQPFSYNLTAEGTNVYRSYPDETFDFTIRGSGTCGGEYCRHAGTGEYYCICAPACTGPPFPCDWFLDLSGTNRKVNGGEGLKFIREWDHVPPEYNNPEDMTWTEIGNTNPRVETDMRAACGDDAAWKTSGIGWIFVKLDRLERIAGTTNAYQYIVSPDLQLGAFDEASLAPGYQRFGGPLGAPSGGIFIRLGPGPLEHLYMPDVEFNGTTGYVQINDYDSEADYFFYALPPNGPKLCAYTAHHQEFSQDWSKRFSEEYKETSYDSPYTKTYNPADLAQFFLPNPGCPPGAEDCEEGIPTYNAVKTFDPYGTVTVSFDPATYKVTATTTSQELSLFYKETLDLSAFPTLLAPTQVGPHLLTLKVIHLGSVLGEGNFTFETCLDNDGDGWCIVTGDCNDENRYIFPAAAESCNGIDDDCDTLIDEDFWAAGRKLGNPCGVGACRGVWVCSQDGSSVTCSGQYSPGELPEICEDGMDNDCDGVTDEEYELVAGQQTKACVCRNGVTQPCGVDIGRCQSGYQICIDHEWSDCMDAVGPLEETCNQIDDDCDGIIDNVGGGTSIETTHCGCFNNAPPEDEKCNDIDDDCNGEIDDGVPCCLTGETRPCGTDIGVCEKGMQTCIEGEWGECLGGITPSDEVCWDNLDNDCDEQVDEDCVLEETCNNGIQDPNEEGVDCGGDCPRGCAPGEVPFPWMLLSVIVLAVIVGVGALAITGRV